MALQKIITSVFWANVRTARLNKGWTQLFIADKLGMSIKTYSSKELGKQSKVLRSLAVKVAEVLGTTVEALSAGQPTAPPPHPYAKFYAAVRKRRESMGITQEGMAELLGMSRTNWAAKELCVAVKRPSISLMAKIAEVLRTTVDELMDKPDKDFNVRRGIALAVIEWYKDRPEVYEEYLLQAMQTGVIVQKSQGNFVLSEKYSQPSPKQDQRTVDAIIQRMSKLMQ